MDKKDIENKLIQLLGKVFSSTSKSELRLNKKREKFENWDSLNHMQLVSEIESAFKISFDMDEIVDIQKPADFIPLIKKKSV